VRLIGSKILTKENVSALPAGTADDGATPEEGADAARIRRKMDLLMTEPDMRERRSASLVAALYAG
jgi:hypothetical protein